MSSDRWAEGRALLRAADPRMAALVDADPGLDPDDFFDNWPSDLWSALVFQVIGQELSLAAAGAIRAGSRHCTTAGGGSMARCRSPRWTLSGTASGRGARWRPCTC